MIQYVRSFQELLAAPFQGEMNAACWDRVLTGDFSEIVEKVALVLSENITTISQEELCALQLSEQGQLAREILLQDMQLLEAHGALPVLNVIDHYERDETFFPTDVYSFHVDRSPVPTDTFLCTYYGEPSEILPNAQGVQKILVPEIREELYQLYDGPAEGFEAFLREHFFDLHYQAMPDARIIKLGAGQLWRLAVDYPGNAALPCLHRAPEERDGKKRLLLIC